MSEQAFIADSSSLIALDRQGDLHLIKGRTALIPRAVRRELVEDARQAAIDSPMRDYLVVSADRFEYYIDRGHLQVRVVDYRQYSELMDRVRKRLAKLEKTKEHQVKKGDVELVALIQELKDDGRRVRFLCEDNALIGIAMLETGDIENISYRNI